MPRLPEDGGDAPRVEEAHGDGFRQRRCRRSKKTINKMKALDLFCGLGGWSDGLAANGFDVTGVEIVPMVAEVYGQKYNVINKDVCELNPENFKGYDLIVGSPPCRDFSVIGLALKNKWKRPPDPEGEGLRLVNVFLDFVEKAKPTYWCMENSPRLEQYLHIKPRTVTYFGSNMRRALWGNFPAFLISTDFRRGCITGGRNRSTGEVRKTTYPFKYGQGKLRTWERAIIPFPIANGLGVAVKQALESLQVI